MPSTDFSPLKLLASEAAAPVLVALLMLAYLGGFLTLSGKARRHMAAGAAAFAIGAATLFVALSPPLADLNDALFSAHMAQHLVIVAAAAPLLTLSSPSRVLARVLPYGCRRRLIRIMRRPLAVRVSHMGRDLTLATTCFAAIFLVVHVPPVYALARENGQFHAGVHLFLLGSALLFWSVVVNSRGRRLPAIGACFFLAAECGMLGFLAVFARDAWYSEPDAPPALGLTPLADQQLGGALMWVLGGLPFL